MPALTRAATTTAETESNTPTQGDAKMQVEIDNATAAILCALVSDSEAIDRAADRAASAEVPSPGRVQDLLDDLAARAGDDDQGPAHRKFRFARRCTEAELNCALRFARARPNVPFDAALTQVRRRYHY